MRRATAKLFKAAYTGLWVAGGSLASPYLLYKLATTPKYRKGLHQRMALSLPPEPESPPIWCHAVSVGEVIAVSELLRAVKGQWPDIPLYISTVTATGQETASNRLGDVAEAIFYLPFDLPHMVSKVVGRVNPRLFLLVETELWPGLITELSIRKVPQILVNGRLSPASFKNYHTFKAFMAPLLSRFSYLCMQSRRDAARMVALGAPENKVVLTGNLKYDTIIASLRWIDPAEVRRELGIPEGVRVLVAGSTHEGEEEALLRVLGRCENVLLVMAPRHPERWDEVAKLLEERGVKFRRRSRNEPLNDAKVLLLDTLGELSRTYAAADVAFVGGSLVEKGGHNPLEPAAVGVPVVMGSHVFNFKEISQTLTEAGGMVVGSNKESTIDHLCRLIENEEESRVMGERGRKAVFDNIGAQDRTLEVIREVMQKLPV